MLMSIGCMRDKVSTKESTISGTRDSYQHRKISRYKNVHLNLELMAVIHLDLR